MKSFKRFIKEKDDNEDEIFLRGLKNIYIQNSWRHIGTINPLK